MKRGGFRFRLAPSPALGALAAVVAAASACASGEAPGPGCEAPSSDCGGACVDLGSDGANCGACGASCPAGAACVDGACEAPGGGGAGGGGGKGGMFECGAVAGMERCGDDCVDTLTDPDHCGACGAACDPGHACAGAMCQPTCLEGFTRCAEGCVDLDVDPRHCGRCGRACDPGRACEGGACGCSADPSLDIGSAVPRRVNGTTRGAGDDRWLSCSEAGTADQTFLFTAPAAGTYLFDTFEADYDTTLGALRADSCAELACNDDAGSVQSQISVDLEEAESILVVVSGASGARGDFTLRVSQPGPIACAPTALEGSVPLRVTGSTVGLEDAVYSVCDFAPSPDATYTFTAPEPGLYVFSAAGAEDLVLEILEGGTCDGDSLTYRCRDGLATATAELEAGQTVLVAVARAGGTLDVFSLEIDEAPPCPRVDLGSTVPQVVSGSNKGLPDVLSGCGSFFSGGEATYGFTAPSDGVYVFDAQEATFPVVLDVRRGGCTGERIACADGAAGVRARVAVPLAARETAIVVVDTEGETGDYTLAISEQPCPFLELGSTAPQRVTGTTAGRDDLLSPACGDVRSPEATYRFTAPVEAVYTFDTEGSSFDTVLDVRDGSCAGRSLRCNDNVDDAGRVTTSRVSVVLSAGQTVVVSVDGNGASGEYTLDVTQQDLTPCPLVDLGSALPQEVTGNSEGYLDLLTPSCASGSGGEATYSFTAPWDAYYTFDTAGSTIETVLAVYDGGCRGDELVCSNDGAGSEALLWLDAGQTVLISVDSNGAAGDYKLNVHQLGGAGTCSEPAELESVVPLVEEGTTMGRLSERASPECGGEATPEFVYSFTAPETGTYTIDTFGSSLDTILYVLDGSCSGEELACNDDWMGGETTRQSRVTLPLEGGQTVFIVVDGFVLARGEYQLNIDVER